MYFPAAGSTWHGINYFSFCGSLLGNTLHLRLRKVTLQKFLNQNLEKRLWQLYCFDKYQRRIQNPVGFNSFKPLTISARSYFLEAWRVSEYPSEKYYIYE